MDWRGHLRSLTFLKESFQAFLSITDSPIGIAVRVGLATSTVVATAYSFLDKAPPPAVEADSTETQEASANRALSQNKVSRIPASSGPRSITFATDHSGNSFRSSAPASRATENSTETFAEDPSFSLVKENIFPDVDSAFEAEGKSARTQPPPSQGDISFISSSSSTSTATSTAPATLTLSLVSGDNQSGTVGTSLSPFVGLASYSDGSSAAGLTTTWELLL